MTIHNWGYWVFDWRFKDSTMKWPHLMILVLYCCESPILRSILWIFCLWTLYTFFLVWHCKHPPNRIEMFYSNYVDMPDHLTFYSNEYCTVDWWQIWWKLFWKTTFIFLNIWLTSRTWHELQLRHEKYRRLADTHFICFIGR